MHPVYCKKYRPLSVISFAVVVSCIPILILSESRAAWLALFLSVLYGVYARWKDILGTKIRKYLLFGSLFLLIILASYPLYYYKKDSADGRLLIWKVTMEMVKDKPLSGFGSDGFKANYMLYQANYLKTKGTTREKYLAGNNFLVYNEPLRILVEHGIIGLLLYGGFITLLLSIPKKKNLVTKASYAIGIGYIAMGFFAYPHLVYPIQLVMLLAFSFRAYANRHILLRISPTANIKRIATAGLLLILVSLLYSVGKSYYGYYRFNCLQETPFRVQEPAKYISQLSKLEELMANEIIFWTSYCSMLEQQKQDSLLLHKISNWEKLYPVSQLYLMKGDALKRTGKPKEAEEAYWTAHYMVPARQVPRGRIALLYKETGREADGLRLAREILNEDVKVYGFDTFELHRELRNTFGLQDGLPMNGE
jgi:hypothetical protein